MQIILTLYLTILIMIGVGDLFQYGKLSFGTQMMLVIWFIIYAPIKLLNRPK